MEGWITSTTIWLLKVCSTSDVHGILLACCIQKPFEERPISHEGLHSSAAGDDDTLVDSRQNLHARTRSEAERRV